MIVGNAKEQSIPLATAGYVTGVRQDIVTQTTLSTGEVVSSARLNVSDIQSVAFNIQHEVVRMSLKSIGGVIPRVRSQGVAMTVSQKTMRLRASPSIVNLTMSKN